MGRDLYFSEKDIEDRLRTIEENISFIEKREDQHSLLATLPVDLWLESGLDEGGIIVIHQDLNIRTMIANLLKNLRYKVTLASNDQEAISALKKYSFSIMIVQWMLYEKSGDFVKLLRRAFPQTKVIILSPSFAWSNESVVGASLGKNALDAGAFSYVPEKHINETVATCVQTAIKSNYGSCPVLVNGLPCNLRCTI